MHMGALATIGQSEVQNFKHILINNGCHDSVGGQPTCGTSETFDFLGIAKSCGYKMVSEGDQLRISIYRHLTMQLMASGSFVPGYKFIVIMLSLVTCFKVPEFILLRFGSPPSPPPPLLH